MAEKFVHMTDGAHHIVVPAEKVDFFKDEKGFSVENDVVLAPGQLCGHIRVRPAIRPPQAGHVANQVEITDGHTMIRADKNHKEQWAVYERKGFLELPAMPEKPDLTEVHGIDEITELMTQWARQAAPILAARDQITEQARDLEDGRPQE